MEQAVSCPICQTKKINFYCEKNVFRLYNCPACQLFFVWPRPNKLADIYQDFYFKSALGNGGVSKFGYADYEEDKKATRNTLISYLDKIAKHAPGRKIFDIGAATGYFLDLASQAGWRTSGIEISEYAAKIARAKGHKIFLGGLENLEINEKYDVVSMWDVLEHLGDPQQYLKFSYDILDEAGILAVNTIDKSSWWARFCGKNWQAIMPPEHLFYFSPKSLKILLEQSGFKILEQLKIGKKFTLPYICKVLAHRYNLPFLGQLAGFLSRAGFKIGLPVNLRDNIFIIAKKAKYS